MELVSVTVPWKPLTLAPLGDIQWSGEPHEIAWDSLQRHIDEALARDAWFLGMGDYLDFMSPSNRARMNAAEFYDRTRKTIDDKARELTHELYERLLKPTRGRWLGLLEGHHYAELRSGMTSDMLLADLLKTQHLGTQALIEVMFQHNGARTPTPTAHSVVLWAFHGEGGGQSVAAPVQKLEQLARDWEGVDVFFLGHMTKVATAPQTRARGNFRAKPYRLNHRDVRLVGTGGWLKALVEGRREGQVPRGNYVEKRGMRLVTLGAPLVTVKPIRRTVDGKPNCWEPEIRVIA